MQVCDDLQDADVGSETDERWQREKSRYVCVRVDGRVRGLWRSKRGQ